MADLENIIEYEVIEYATEKGVMQLKLNVIGRVGWPDRLLLYRGRILFIEFKKLGERVRGIQLHIHQRIREQGFPVAVVDSVANGKDLIDKFTKNGTDLRTVYPSR